MKVTNQAFIKAYRHDGPQAPPPRPTFSSRTAMAVNQLYTSVHVVSVDEARSLGGDETRAAETTLLSPAPRALGAQETEVHVVTTEDRSLRSVHAPSGAKRPLSFFTCEGTDTLRRDDPALPPPVQSPSFAPQQNVSAFLWPEVCQTLGRECATDFARITNLLVSRADGARSLIGVASLHAGQGCTTTLLCLAAQLKARNGRVILVDGNFTAPQLADRLDVDPHTTWQDVLETQTAVAAAIVHSEQDRLDLLPLGRPSALGPRLAAGAEASVTAGVLRYAYDLVLVDLGAILDLRSQATALELISSMRIDAVLAVAGPEGADEKELAHLGQLFAQRDCELLGTIENRIPCPLTSDP